MAVRTPCPFCAIQCSLDVNTERMESGPSPDDPISQGYLCIKGRYSAELTRHPLRLSAPMIRADRNEWREVTWDQALENAAQRLNHVKRQYGADSIFVYGSGALPNEAAYLLGKLARVGLGTSELDYNGRFCMASASYAYTTQFGLDRPTATVEDIAFSDVILIAGSNLSEAHPMLMPHVQKARRRGTRLIVIDPRKTRLGALADIHVPIRPGTDSFLAWGLLSALIEENLVNRDFITNSTEGYGPVSMAAQEFSPEAVADIVDISAETIRQVARLFAKGPRSLFLHGRGIEQYRHGVETVGAFLNVVLATGQVGRMGTGAIMLTGQANGQGGREMGQKSEQLPGCRSIDNDNDRRHISRIWKVNPAELPRSGRYRASDFVDGIMQGDIRALVVVGANPLLSAPNTERVSEALNKLDLLIVLDPLMTETAERAQIVLPSGGFGTNEGTVTNLEARVLAVRPFMNSAEPHRPDWWVMAELGKRLSDPSRFSYQSSLDVFDEIRHATRGASADYYGMNRDKIGRNMPYYWPCPLPGTHGTMRLYTRNFSRLGGRALFSDHGPALPIDRPDEQSPWHLLTGRLLRHYNTGIQTRNGANLPHPSTARVSIHPGTAKRLGIKKGDAVVVENRRGRLLLSAHLDDSLRPDTVFIPIHNDWLTNPNRLIPDGPLGLAKMPEFKHSTVRVTPGRPTTHAARLVVEPIRDGEEETYGILSCLD